jgi:hypothetical protein
MPELPESPTLLAWEALDGAAHERSHRWYLMGGVALLTFAAYGLFEGSWSTTLVALGLGGIYVLLRKHPPRPRTTAITTMGIKLGESFFPWNMLRDFWILIGPKTPEGQRAELHLSSYRTMQPEIVAFIEGIDPALIRETLLAFLPERPGMEERTLDMLGRLLKL